MSDLSKKLLLHGSLLLGAVALFLVAYTFIGPNVTPRVTGDGADESETELGTIGTDNSENTDTPSPTPRSFTPPEVEVDVLGPPTEEDEEEATEENTEESAGDQNEPEPEQPEEEPIIADDPDIVTPDDPVPPEPQVPEGETVDPGSAGGIDPGDAFEVGPTGSEEEED